jgi:hypothetical protein
MEPANHQLEPLKPWVKINFPSVKLFISGILSQQQETD